MDRSCPVSNTQFKNEKVIYVKLVFLLSEPTFARLALPCFCLSVLNFAVGVEDVTWPSFSYTCLSATVELVTPGDD